VVGTSSAGGMCIDQALKPIEDRRPDERDPGKE